MMLLRRDIISIDSIRVTEHLLSLLCSKSMTIDGFNPGSLGAIRLGS